MMTKVTVSNKLCKKCGICVFVCPKNVFSQSPGMAPVPERIEDCIGCGTCELKCPDFAVEVIKEDV